MNEINSGVVKIALIATVVVILVAALLAPVISSASEKERTFTNDGVYYMDKLGESESRTLEWDYQARSTVLVNGESVALPAQEGSWTIIAGNDFCVRALVTNTYVSIHAYFNDGSGVFADSYDEGDGMTIVITDSSVIVATNTESVSHTFTTHGEIFCISSQKEDYVMKVPTKGAYLNADSKIFFAGRTADGGVSLNISGEGNIQDGIALEQFYGSAATFTTPEISAVEQDKYLDLYLFDKISFTITQGSNVYDATYNYVIVPAEVTAELVNAPSDGQIALYKAIPVMVLVALIALVAVPMSNRE